MNYIRINNGRRRSGRLLHITSTPSLVQLVLGIMWFLLRNCMQWHWLCCLEINRNFWTRRTSTLFLIFKSNFRTIRFRFLLFSHNINEWSLFRRFNFFLFNYFITRSRVFALFKSLFLWWEFRLMFSVSASRSITSIYSMPISVVMSIKLLVSIRLRTRHFTMMVVFITKIVSWISILSQRVARWLLRQFLLILFDMNLWTIFSSFIAVI